MPICHGLHPKATLRATMVALLLGSLLQVLGRYYPHFHPDLIDGLRGFFLGIAIGTIVLTTRKSGKHLLSHSAE